VSEPITIHAAEPGDTIAHYRLLERLGRDKDTTIYRARDLRLTGRDLVAHVDGEITDLECTSMYAVFFHEPELRAIHLHSHDYGGVATGAFERRSEDTQRKPVDRHCAAQCF